MKKVFLLILIMVAIACAYLYKTNQDAHDYVDYKLDGLRDMAERTTDRFPRKGFPEDSEGEMEFALDFLEDNTEAEIDHNLRLKTSSKFGIDNREEGRSYDFKDKNGKPLEIIDTEKITKLETGKITKGEADSDNRPVSNLKYDEDEHLYGKYQEQLDSNYDYGNDAVINPTL